MIGQATERANALTAGIAGQGVDRPPIAVIVMAIIVLVTFVIWVAVLALLLVVAPLALLFHALPQTEALAFLWWRAVASWFAIQLGQTAVLVAAVRIFLTPLGPTTPGFPASGSGWLAILVALAMMWLLVKIPMWVRARVRPPRR